MALRRGLELARRELFRGELDDPMRAVLIFSRKLGEALAQRGRLHRRRRRAARGARHGRARAGRTARACSARSPTSRTGATGARRRSDYLREALELATRSGAHELVTSLETLQRSIAV